MLVHLPYFTMLLHTDLATSLSINCCSAIYLEGNSMTYNSIDNRQRMTGHCSGCCQGIVGLLGLAHRLGIGIVVAQWAPTAVQQVCLWNRTSGGAHYQVK